MMRSSTHGVWNWKPPINTSPIAESSMKSVIIVFRLPLLPTV